jgi:hypothetical protein
MQPGEERGYRESSLLTLLEEVEASGVTDPVAYLMDLVRRERAQQGQSGGQSEIVVAYEQMSMATLVPRCHPDGTWMGQRNLLCEC